MEFVVYLIGVAFLFAYLARDDGRCHVCGAPANAQRHASECPWGDPPYAQYSPQSVKDGETNG